MVTPVWYLLFILIGILGAVFELPWLVSFCLIVLLLLGLANLWNIHALRNVTYRRIWRYRRGFSGEILPLRLEIENNKFLPLSWLRIADSWPASIAPDEEKVLAPSHVENESYLMSLQSLRGFQRATRSYHLTLRQRGVYQIGPYDMESGDLFGLFRTSRTVEKLDLITVFPDLLPLQSLKLRTDDPFGDQQARRRLYEDPTRPMGVRDYQPDDDFRRIHWNATARTGQLQVKVYQPISARVLVICLNVTTLKYHWLGANPGMLEQLIKTAATLAYHSVQDGYAVGLYSNGCLAHADQPFRIQPGRSPQQLGVLLQALAGVTSFITAPFEKFLLRYMPQIPYGATLVVLTAFITPELTDVLAKIKHYRRNITLFTLQPDPPESLPGIQVIHLPFES